MKFELKKTTARAKTIAKKIAEEGVFEALALTGMILFAVVAGSGGCTGM